MDKLLVALLALCCFNPVKSRYLITTPRIYRTGTIETLNVNLYDSKGSWNITASLKIKDKIVATATHVFQGDSQGKMEMKIPNKVGIPYSLRHRQTNAKLNIVGFKIGSKSQKFNETQSLTIEKQDDNLFIQTDKPIYKPGQTIQMRVIGIKPNLKPLVGKLERVTVANPSGVRMMQWNNLELKDGMQSLKMPLSNQPILGNWKIQAVFNGKTVTKKIEVSKYVLPKFEVTIEPPSFIAVDSKLVAGTICARYTYGQLVTGTMKVTFQIKRSWWWRRSTEKKIQIEAKVKGCYQFSLKNNELGLDNMKYSYHGSRLNITATMTEEATGITRPAESTETSIVPYRVKLNFYEGTPRFFKPGLPFYGQLRVQSPDGQPLSKEDIRITAKYGGKTFYSKHFVVQNGVVDFQIKDIPHRYTYIALDARHGKGDIFGKDYASTNWYPTAGIHCTPWYSKTWSVLAIEKPKLLKVGTKARIDFKYTSMERKFNSELFYQVMCGGNVTVSGSKSLKFEDKSQVAASTTSSTSTTPPTITTTATTATQTTTLATTSSPGSPDRQWVSPVVEPVGPTKDERPNVSTLYKGNDFIEFQVTQSMVPSCRLLVFYVKKDGETVADSIVVKSEGKLENQVVVRFDDSVRKPGEHVQITMKAAPGSTVALAGVDKSVRLLKAADDLTSAKVLAFLASQDVGASSYNPRRTKCDEFDHWGGQGGFPGSVPLRRKRSIYPPYSRSNFVDASKAFQDAGVIYFSDLTVESRPCPKFYGWRSREFGLGLGGGGGGAGGGALSGGAVNGPVAVPFVMERMVPTTKTKKRSQAPTVRKNFPETWLWTEETISNSSGQRTIKAKVPDTITSWHLNAFAMSSKSGIGVSDPSELTVFQPFFVSFTLPYSVIRGEEVSVITTVFNYMSKCATVRISLTKTEHFNLTSSVHHNVCICGNEAKSVNYVITPLQLGNIPLKVTVKNVQPSLCKNTSEEAALGIFDAVQRKLLVEPEGVRQEYTYNNFICREDAEEDFFHDNIEVSLPESYVPGSVHATLSAIGDLMGPSLSGLEELLRLPTGCGEQNMVKFAPNIYIMQYLKSTNQLTGSIEDKALGFLRTGYQRELTYKRKDGSYSAFGDRDKEGSLWLTAFVVRSFSQARPFIFIDEEEINSTLKWIKGKQLDTGCFRKHGQLFNKALKGGVSTPVTLTAYVVISLLESNLDAKNIVIAKALRCISSQRNSAIDAYSSAIIAYALTLAKHPDRPEFLRRLKAQAIVKDGLMHWEKKEKPQPQLSFGWQPPYHRSRSTNIEMTAYALMAIIGDGTDTNAITDSLPIIRWITKQRNALGGFSSTQDTCIALQGLSKYARFIYGRGVTRMRIDVGYPGAKFRHNYRIDDSNRLVLQRVEIPEKILHTKKIPIDAVGQGCALVQTDVSYNIPDVEETPAFDVLVSVQPHKGLHSSVVTSEAGEQLCQPLEMSVCARWLENGESGMAVIDVKLVSGYSANEESLKRLMNRFDLNLMRFELNENNLILYFNEITNVCVTFGIEQTSVVKKTKPASVKVYEYYDTDKSATSMYNITEDLCLPEPEPPTTPPPTNPCPLCPKRIDVRALRKIICKTNHVMAIRTVKAGQTRLEYIVSRKVFASDKPLKKNIRPLDVSVPKACSCSVLGPRNKALILLQQKRIEKSVKKLKLDENSVVLPRKAALATLLRDALRKCTPKLKSNQLDP